QGITPAARAVCGGCPSNADAVPGRCPILGDDGTGHPVSHPRRSTLMLPDPLHPAVVHFPVVLAFLVPVFAAGAMWAIRRGARARRAWAIPLALAVVLSASAWASVETGEDQEERVERVVGERPLHAHQEMAEVFLG